MKITDLSTDLSTGEILIQLLEIISGEETSPFGKYNKNPKLRIQKVENLNKALDFIRKRGVHLTNIGSEDIVDCNGKLILGLIWTIILRFTIADIRQGDRLLLWCQRKTAPYSQDFSIKDFTMSWQSGLALCALIHRHRPDLLDYYALNKGDKHKNTQLAFDVAEKHLGIPKLFGVEDIVDVVKPDERSVMTYVAQYFHAFSSLDKVGTAGRRIGQFGQVVQSVWEMQNDYERRVRALMAATEGIQRQWSSQTFSNYPDAKRLLQDFETYKVSLKREWIVEKSFLDSLFGNIQTKLKTYNIKPYTPPAGLLVQDLDSYWEQHIAIEAQRKRTLNAFIKEIKESLTQRYAEAANGFEEKLSSVAFSLANLEGSLEVSIGLSGTRLDRLKARPTELTRLDALLSLSYTVLDNPFTIYTIEDLRFDLDLLSQSLQKKYTFVENQIIARSKTNITPELLEEMTETFNRVCKDGSNKLKFEEFKAALQAQGTFYPEDKALKIFADAAAGSETMSFDQYLDFMKSIQEDKTGPKQLEEAFDTIAGEGEITESDLYRSGLAPPLVEYFKVVIPRKANNAFDYKQYISSIFTSSD
ncbi:calponin domain-containing protein [Polychytrium aggregatum]|uniref:calponin domain-containing protein n=1 Tax=Polychytrium aggregatum TaxID=110093 RepID=UPI0022FED78E|nr:calponin domain-containing protein [Polychytrium aggregatum]KAI9209821.1 calponin homology domain-containing protein [Polychytrium aggregatum]